MARDSANSRNSKFVDIDAAIARTAEQWQSAIDAIQDPIFIHDPEFRIVRANKAYAREAGLPIQEVVGKFYWEVFPRLSGPLPGCEYSQERHEEVQGELELEDGRILFNQAYCALNKQGEHAYSVHVLRDITELRKHERENLRLMKELRYSEAHLSLIAESVPDILFTMNAADLELVYVNSAVERLLGYDPRQLMREPSLWLTFLHEDDRQTVLTELRQAREERREAKVECRFWRKSGVDFLWFDARARWSTDPGGDESQLSGVLTEISVRKQAEREREQAAERIRTTLVQTIQAIAAILDKRDPYTAGHQRRVTDLATAIARDMGLDDECIRGIELGGLVHDIGKIYVPAEILNRPGKLLDVEFALIKTHPTVGYEILKDVAFPWPVADMVRQHHERIDGSGYPDGLRGDEIILEARILAVADVVEAITSHRPYRPALGVKAAIAEIERGRGSLYDARVVDTCIRLLSDGAFTFG